MSNASDTIREQENGRIIKILQSAKKQIECENKRTMFESVLKKEEQRVRQGL